jgi:hypothetical protein
MFRQWSAFPACRTCFDIAGKSEKAGLRPMRLTGLSTVNDRKGARLCE